MVKKALSLSVLVLLIIGGFMLYLYKTGYWLEENIALRKLDSLEIPATPSQVRDSVSSADRDTLTLLGKAGVDFNAPETFNEENDPPLHAAAKKEDWETFKTIYQFSPDPELPDAAGLPVTTHILESANLTLAETLFKDGAEVNIPHPSGDPALIHYLKTEQFDKARFLLDQKADPNTASKEKQNALFYTIKANHTEETVALLNAGADPNATSPSAEKPLYLTIKENQGDLTSALLEAGADPNIKTVDGTPLFPYFTKSLPELTYSAEERNTTITQLIEKGADLNAVDEDGWRPLQWLLHHRYTETADLVISADPNVDNTLWVALDNNDYLTASKLLNLKANPNEIGASGDSPLLSMIRKNRADMVTELLNHGANPDQNGQEGQSALVTAIALKHTDSALALLRHPERPAAHSTLMGEEVSEDFRLLFGKRGYFDWYCANCPGLTPLMAAVMMKELAVAEQLISNGADRFQGTLSRYKVYPIQMASKNMDVKMQQLLIGVSYKEEDQVRKFIIDLSEQMVRYYENGELKKTSRVSSGQSGFRTKPGQYVITDKTRHKRSNIYDGAEMPYFQRFSCGAIGFHYGNTYSRYASHGCIRLPMSTAKYFWGETSLGDRVDIVK